MRVLSSPKSSLKVTDLKALCLDNSLPVSGNKTELIQRLSDAGVDDLTLGLIKETKLRSIEKLEDEEVIFLEDETESSIDDVFTAEIGEAEEVLETVFTDKKLNEEYEDEVLDAVIMDAEIIEEDFVESEIASGRKESVLSLKERTFITACRARAIPECVVVLKHLLPHTLNPVIVAAML